MFGQQADAAQNNQDWLIGYNDWTVEGDFVWDGGAPFTYDNWDFGEPVSATAHGSTAISSGQRRPAPTPRTTHARSARPARSGTRTPTATGSATGPCSPAPATPRPVRSPTTPTATTPTPATRPTRSTTFCNGVDDDCDGIDDENCSCTADTFDGHDYELCTSAVTWDAARSILRAVRHDAGHD